MSDSNIDPENFPASKGRQLAKKMESSKSTARHIKQFSSEPQATQVHLLEHQRIELPPTKSKQKQFNYKKKPRPKEMSYPNENKQQQVPHRSLIQHKFLTVMIDATRMEIPSILRDSSVLPINISAEIVKNMVIVVACTTKARFLQEKAKITQSSSARSGSSLYARKFNKQPVEQ